MDGETLGENDALGLTLTPAAMTTWMPSRARPVTSSGVPLPADSAAS